MEIAYDLLRALKLKDAPAESETMQPRASFDQNKIVVLTPAGSGRDTMAKLLKGEGFQATFVDKIDGVIDALARLSAGFFLHDWSTSDPAQGARLHHVIAKNEDFSGVCRILHTPSISQQVVALAYDTGVRRVIGAQATVLNLISELRMAVTSWKNMSPEQALIHQAHALGALGTEELDQAVRVVYEQFRNDAVVRLAFADLRLREGKADSARTIATQVLEAQPQNVRAMDLLARIAIAGGKLDEAVAPLTAASALTPHNAARMAQLGELLVKRGEYAKVAALFEAALAIDPELVAAKKGLGIAKVHAGDIVAALAILEGCATEEESASIFNRAAVEAGRRGQHEESLKLYKAALGLLRTNKLKPAVLYNVALAYVKLGQSDEALKAVEQVLAFDPKHEKALRLEKRLANLEEWSESA